jgi:phosphatidylserine/phosphatidylglycerophosphate/cardiolipin synthase-like enzyme
MPLGADISWVGAAAMKRLLCTATFCLLFVLGCEKKAPQNETIAVGQDSIQVYFSPRGGTTDAVVKTLDGAKKSILVQAYSFTSDPIAEALKRAHVRNVNVMVVLDKSQRTAKYTSLEYLAQAGIPVWIDSKHAIQHNKVMVIDDATVITGSFNFSKAAEERNAENLLIISNPMIAKMYTENWERCRAHSE